MKKYIGVEAFLVLLCLLTFTNITEAAELEDPYSSFISGLDKIASAKIGAEASTIVYDGKKIVTGSTVTSKGSGMQVSSTTFDSFSYVETAVGDDERSLETKMDFVRKGNDIYIKFKYGLAKNKWIKLRADEYEEFGVSLDLEAQFDLADFSDPRGEDKALMEKLALLAEKHNLYVNYEEPLTKKKNGKTLTTYSLEFDRKAVVPFFTEASTTLSEDEKKMSVLGVKGFMDALKSKIFVDSLVEKSYVRIVFDEANGLPVEYTEKLIVPQHKNVGLSLEQFSHMKFDNINKKVNIKVPTKFISPEAALKIMGLDD